MFKFFVIDFKYIKTFKVNDYVDQISSVAIYAFSVSGLEVLSLTLYIPNLNI